MEASINDKNIVNTQNASKPMVAIDVSELDYDPELLNTPAGTIDLSKGMEGMHPHDPDDLITKITTCAPGDKEQQLWEDSLQLFFCKDPELIDYVQEIVGMAAIGKVCAEHTFEYTAKCPNTCDITSVGAFNVRSIEVKLRMITWQDRIHWEPHSS